MASNITPERRRELEDYLKEHPIDPAWDEECEFFDGDYMNKELDIQLTARLYKLILDRNPE